MKLTKLTLILFTSLASLAVNAEESAYEYLLIRDQTDFVKMRRIIVDQSLALHNLRNVTQESTKWTDKDLRVKSLDCDIQNLEEIELRILKKNRNLFTEQQYKKQLINAESFLKNGYIPNCDYIKKEDSKVNWKVVTTIYPSDH